MPMPKRTAAEQDAALDALEQGLVVTIADAMCDLHGAKAGDHGYKRLTCILAKAEAQLAALRALRAKAKPRVLRRGWLVIDSEGQEVSGLCATRRESIQNAVLNRMFDWMFGKQVERPTWARLRREGCRAVRVTVREEGADA